MIKVEITGTLPQVNTDLSPVMAEIAERLYGSAIEQFQTSGHGSWMPTREGQPATLRGVQDTLEKDSGDNWAQISFMNTIHQRGGTMILTERQKGYFWAMHYDTGDDKWKWMALSRSGIMKFPIRAITLMKQDFDFMRKKLIDRVFTIKEIVQ